ncbi:MAG: allophanate hydrolase [Verrucomicrobia bacterium]|nr:allophanate hydrolase [Verrucomicrobiota bacterium]
MSASVPSSLDLATLAAAYEAGASPVQVVREIFARIRTRGDDHVWISLRPEAEVLAEAAALVARRSGGEKLPLYGAPFAVKDNLDVAGLPTTAACPAFSYAPAADAEVVRRLRAAGALVLGKTNLDQFATGLVGVRSPYGAPSCVFDPEYISGGSSSGSAVATAAGLVSFALGTDTAGSGRVPAAFNNLVGWKPTKGLLSTRGLVPACRSLDCVSVFTLTCADAAAIASVVSAYDEADPYSRPAPKGASAPAALARSAFRFGVPRPEQLEFFGDRQAAGLYAAAVTRMRGLGGTPVEIDFTPFRETAELLYAGPWVAERLAAISPFAQEHPEALHPVTAKIIGEASRLSAVDTFRAFYRLEELRRRAAAVWSAVEVLLLPTTPTIYTHAELAAEPVLLNSRLGTYTNFVNLLDLSALAVPAGFRADGVPLGVTLMGPAFSDAALLRLGARFHEALGGKLGGTGMRLSAVPPTHVEQAAVPAKNASSILLAVVGAHLTGQPLNHQLTSRAAEFIGTFRTAADYKLFALAGTTPPKPGLVREPGFSGPGLEVELWRLSPEAFGAFTAEVPAPLAIGTLVLADGRAVKGFVCEPSALNGATEITAFGGWRYYLGSLTANRMVPVRHAVV